MSPEQTGQLNRPVDSRSDLYSLGIVFYQLLAGRLPFEAEDAVGWVHCHVARQPRPLDQVRPPRPRPLVDLVGKLLAKLPDHRYQSAAGLRHDLERCLREWTERGVIAAFPLGERDVSEEFPARHPQPGAVVLEVDHLSAPPRFSDVSFSVRQGEIVGLAGLVGAGRTSTALAIAGALHASGAVRLNGRPVRFRSPAEAIEHGIAYVTEDRKGRGIFPVMGTGENITIAYLRAYARAGLLRPPAERAAAAAKAREFDVRAARLSQPASTLSGGNQQKMLLARYLLKRRDLVILDEPTRGVDVGARAEIYGLMNRLTAEGLAILMISSELPEVLGMADRIVVLREGRTMGELARAAATPERVMGLATRT